MKLVEQNTNDMQIIKTPTKRIVYYLYILFVLFLPIFFIIYFYMTTDIHLKQFKKIMTDL